VLVEESSIIAKVRRVRRGRDEKTSSLRASLFASASAKRTDTDGVAVAKKRVGEKQLKGNALAFWHN